MRTSSLVLRASFPRVSSSRVETLPARIDTGRMRDPSLTMRIGAAAFALLLANAPAQAHHAFAAEYDENKIVRVSGTVTEFQWTNPHAWLYVHGKDETGKVGNWRFEMGSPGGLINRGWKKMELKKGDRITVDGYLAKHASNTANARTVTMPDGRNLFGGFQETPGNPFKKAAKS